MNVARGGGLGNDVATVKVRIARRQAGSTRLLALSKEPNTAFIIIGECPHTYQVAEKVGPLPPVTVRKDARDGGSDPHADAWRFSGGAGGLVGDHYAS
jgi:hypothetical protein